MSRKIQLRRGKKKDLPVLGVAELGFTTDTHELYVGYGEGNIQLGKTGEKGDVGPRGERGPKGEQGETGPRGLPGSGGSNDWNEIENKPNNLETTEGAKEKADAAERKAKTYADEQIALIPSVDLSPLATKAELQTHKTDTMPHQFTSDGVAYKGGFNVNAAKDGLVFNYEEV